MGGVDRATREYEIVLTAGVFCVLVWFLSRWPCVTCGSGTWCAQDSCSGVWSTPEFLTASLLISLVGSLGTALGVLGWSPRREPRRFRVRLPRRSPASAAPASARTARPTGPVRPVSKVPVRRWVARRRTVLRRAPSADPFP